MRGAPQATVCQSLEFSGIGLHSGEECKIAIRPAPVGAGIVYWRADIEAKCEAGKAARTIIARPETVSCSDHGTKISNEIGVSVATIEHLMAAFAICGIDNALVEVNGPEIPILDGSSAAFVEGIRTIGSKQQNATRDELIIRNTVRVGDDHRFIEFSPSEEFVLDISIQFEDCLIGRQSLSLHLEDIAGKERLARSRTFCRIGDVAGLRERGLARGGSLDNSLVVDGDRLLNDCELRDPEEFVLHKALDLIGDLYLIGRPIRGAIRAEKPGHDLNIRAARALEQMVSENLVPASPLAATA